MVVPAGGVLDGIAAQAGVLHQAWDIPRLGIVVTELPVIIESTGVELVLLGDEDCVM